MARCLADRYMLGEQIAVGGTSRVYQARDQRLRRPVAVKCLDASLVASSDPGGRSRFLREATTSARFNHHHAVTVYDAGEDDGDLFIVMELVRGPSLANVLASNRQLPMGEVLRIASQASAALAAAHEVGIVHRDVKPANILLDHAGNVKLADFGLAKRFDDLADSVTTVGMVMGTPRYLAPEQVTNGPTGPPSDVFAMGVVMYEMLAGVPPFDADTVTGALAQVQAGLVTDVRSLRPDTPGPLADLVHRSLAHNPDDRPQDATVLAAELAAMERVAAGRAPRVVTSVPPIDAHGVDTVSVAVTTAITPTQVMAVGPAADQGFTDSRFADNRFDGSAPPPGAAPSWPPPPHRRRNARWGVLVGAAAVVVLVAGLTLGRGSPMPASGLPGQADAEQVDPDQVALEQQASNDPTQVVPGFPVTDDVGVFLAQLEQNPALVGAQGERLARDLRKVLEESSADKQQREAEKLLDRSVEWARKDELHSAVVWALAGLLAPMVESDDDDDDD